VQKIQNSITKRTKAIIPVHLFGQPAKMDTIMELAGRYGLIVIEDACQAIGASYRGVKTGAWGHAACFSFFPTKNLGCFGDGGIITTNDDKLAEKLRILRAHGSSKKYHSNVIGYNSRLDELQAAVLRVKLKYLDAWNEERRAKAKRYRELLAMSGLILPQEADGVKQVYHLFVVRHQKRDQLIKALEGRQIGCGVYYPVPIHLQEVYKPFYQGLSLPAAEAASEETLAIPLYPELTDEQLDGVAEELIEIMQDLEKQA
jgi:dTDP-4-amino-4,6-dideoxygalactose transaminase